MGHCGPRTPGMPPKERTGVCILEKRGLEACDKEERIQLLWLQMEDKKV